jgi:hypothetical protein
MSNHPSGSLDAINGVNRAVEQINAKSVVLSRLFTLLSESKVDFCGMREPEFWDGLNSIVNEMGIAASEAGDNADSLWQSLRGGAR